MDCSTQLVAADTQGLLELINLTSGTAATSFIREERIYIDEQIAEFKRLDKVTPEVKEALAKLL